MNREQQIVAEARKWLGTPYHHSADVLGVGVDCAMLLVRVFCDLGLVTPFDPRPYPPDWHLHRSEERFLSGVLSYADEVTVPQPGDVVLFKLGRCLSHGGVIETVASEPVMIHADMAAGKVCRAEVRSLQKRFAGYWRVRA